MKNTKTTILLGDEEKVSGILSIPEGFKKGEGIGVIVAHGAGNDMTHPLLGFFSEGLAAAGYLSLRFNFPYKEKGKKAPDPPKKLDRTWLSVYEFFQTESSLSPDRIFAAGKSMGGRLASQLVAAGKLSVEGLIFLGYPLHPPGKKEKLRDSHLYSINIPMLFFAGTRDPLCNLELLKMVLKRLKAPWKLEVIDGGDHSFKLPKSYLISDKEVQTILLRKTIAWIKNNF